MKKKKRRIEECEKTPRDAAAKWVASERGGKATQTEERGQCA